MRFGAHVSSSGGISKAIGRGVALGCESLQVFTHNPRTWRPIRHTDEEIAAFRAGAADAGIAPVVSHGLYLINLGAPDREVPTGPPGKPAVAMRNIYRASVESLVQHLATGHALGLDGVVLHVGSFKGSTEAESIARIGAGIAEAFDASEGDCPVFLENTAGAGDTIGRTFAQLRAVADAVGVPQRLAFCLDSQHLFASGYPIHEDGSSPFSTSSSAWTACASCTSTTRRSASPRTATATRTSATARSARRGCGASWATPTCRACP